MSKLALQGNDAGTGTFTLQAPATNLNRNLVLPDVDGTLSTMEQVKLPIGSFMWFTGTVAPEAFIVADGQLRSRTAFPDLWAFAQASGNISVDDVSWTFGQYSPGDGATTFRVPKVDDRFIRGKSATRSVGLVEEDVARVVIETQRTSFNSSALVADWWDSASRLSPGNSYGSTIVASQTHGGEETRPKALTMLPCIKAYDVISDPSVLNAVEVVNEISRLESEKLRKDENINLGVSVAASGTAIDFVGIPEGVKRITVMFDGISTNGTSYAQTQLGATTIKTSEYNATRGGVKDSTSFSSVVSSGFPSPGNNRVTDSVCGSLVLTNLNTTTWSAIGITKLNTAAVMFMGGSVTLSGTLDRIRITTVNGTDQFDAGTINISWEF